MAEIKKIVLKVGDAEIELTPDEARELRSALNELYGKPAKEYIPYPVRPWPEPRPWVWPYPRYEWSSGGSTTTFQPKDGVVYMATSSASR